MSIHLVQQGFRVMAIWPNLTVSVPKMYPHWTAMQMCHFTRTKWDRNSVPSSRRSLAVHNRYKFQHIRLWILC